MSATAAQTSTGPMTTFAPTPSGWSMGRCISRRGATLLLLACLFGCGGGWETAPPGAGRAPPPPRTVDSDVTIEVLSSDGSPLQAATVRIVGSVDVLDRVTDVNGKAHFSKIPLGASWVSVAREAHHGAERQLGTLSPDASLTFTLHRAREFVPVVLDAKVQPGADAAELSVELRVAILGEEGQPNRSLEADAFSTSNFGWFTEADGRYAFIDVAAGSHDRSTFSFIEAVAAPTSSIGLLLDHSAGASSADPSRLQLGALERYAHSLHAPDSMAVATMRGGGPGDGLQIHNGFSSDGSTISNAIAALSGHESGDAAPASVPVRMIEFVSANTPIGSAMPSRSLLILTTAWAADASCPDGGWGIENYYLTPCAASANQIAASARAASVPVTLIGIGTFGLSIPMRTGGAYAPLQHADQLNSLAPALPGVVGRSLGHYRLRIKLSGAPGTFVPGRTVWTYVRVQVNADTTLSLTLDIPV